MFSVLKGEMSLIGPRPERPEIEKILKEKISHYNLKYLVVSGWAQVNYHGSSIEDSKYKIIFRYFLHNKIKQFFRFHNFLKNNESSFLIFIDLVLTNYLLYVKIQ